MKYRGMCVCVCVCGVRRTQRWPEFFKNHYLFTTVIFIKPKFILLTFCMKDHGPINFPNPNTSYTPSVSLSECHSCRCKLYFVDKLDFHDQFVTKMFRTHQREVRMSQL